MRRWHKQRTKKKISASIHFPGRPTASIVFSATLNPDLIQGDVGHLSAEAQRRFSEDRLT
jgi:hypothetical protein